MNEKNVMNYSLAMERLEIIMNDIQSGKMNIETLTDALKEADELVKFCRSKLYDVDEEVKAILQKIGDDSFGGE